MDKEPEFPIFDGPMPSTSSSTSSVPSTYALPPEEENLMARFAAHLSNGDAISPLERRLATFREEQERERIAREKPPTRPDEPEPWRLASKEADETAPFPQDSSLGAAITKGPLVLVGLSFYNELAGAYSGRAALASIGCALAIALFAAWDIRAKQTRHHRVYQEALARLNWRPAHKH